MDIDDPLTSEERAAFMAVCPNIKRVTLSAELELPSLMMCLGVGAVFTDGLMMGMKMRFCSNPEDRDRLLRTAAVKLRDWHKAKTDG